MKIDYLELLHSIVLKVQKGTETDRELWIAERLAQWAENDNLLDIMIVEGVAEK